MLLPVNIFGMAAMPFLCNGILLIQCNLPRVLSVLVLNIAICLIPYIDSFLILYGEWPSYIDAIMLYNTQQTDH